MTKRQRAHTLAKRIRATPEDQHEQTTIYYHLHERATKRALWCSPQDTLRIKHDYVAYIVLFLNPENIIASSPFIRPEIWHVPIVRYKGNIPKNDLAIFARKLSGVFNSLVDMPTRIELTNRGDWSFGVDQSTTEICDVLVKSAEMFGKKYSLVTDPWESEGRHVSWH